MTEAFLSRDLLAKHFGDDYRMIAEFEAQAEAVKTNTTSIEETAALKDAAVLVLSGNGEFTNEYVLVVGSGLGYEIAPGVFTIYANPGGVADADYGDITVAAGVWSIDAGAVTLAKQANMATASVVYRKTAGAGPPEVQPLATLKTDLGLTNTNSGDQTTTGTADQIIVTNGATNPVISLPATVITPGALTVTTNLLAYGNLNIRGAAHNIGPNGATLADCDVNFYNTNYNTFYTFWSTNGNTTAPQNQFSMQIWVSGCRFTTLATASLYFRIGATDRLTIDATGVVVTGVVTASGAVSGSNLSGTNTGDQTITLTGDVTGSGTGSFATTIGANKVTDAMLAQVATATFKGRATAGIGNVEVLTATQATSLLDLATTAIKGLMSSADKTKLDGVATGATANATDAALRDRATHTGVETVAVAGTPLNIDSTDSTAIKLTLKDGGVLRSSIGAGAARLFSLTNAAGVEMVFVGNGGNLSIITADPAFALFDNDTATHPQGRLRFFDSANAERAWIGRATGGVAEQRWHNASGAIEIAPAGVLGATFSAAGLVVVGQVGVTDDAFAAGWNGSVNVPTKNAVYDFQVSAASHFRSLLDCSGSHTAARAAGTYWMGQGDALGITGVGTLYPPNVIYLDPADYPAAGNLTAKLRLRIGLYTNDVAPGGNYTFGLHPVTRPATSGGAALAIYTVGAAVASSTVLFTAPAADGLLNAVSAEIVVPAAGHYVIGLVTTAAVAASAHVHASAILQMRYT